MPASRSAATVGGQAVFSASAGSPLHPEPLPSGAQMSRMDARTTGALSSTSAQSELVGATYSVVTMCCGAAHFGAMAATSATSVDQKAGRVE
jgi:hypothetical protein